MSANSWPAMEEEVPSTATQKLGSRMESQPWLVPRDGSLKSSNQGSVCRCGKERDFKQVECIGVEDPWRLGSSWLFWGILFPAKPIFSYVFPQTLATLGVLVVGVKTGCSSEVVAKRAPIQTSIEIEISSRDLAKRPLIGSFYRDLAKRHL